MVLIDDGVLLSPGSVETEFLSSRAGDITVELSLMSELSGAESNVSCGCELLLSSLLVCLSVMELLSCC